MAWWESRVKLLKKQDEITAVVMSLLHGWLGLAHVRWTAHNEGTVALTLNYWNHLEKYKELWTGQINKIINLYEQSVIYIFIYIFTFNITVIYNLHVPSEY